MLYKKVKNPRYPGRAPKGYEWVRGENGVLTNDKGECAYQEATATPAPKNAVKAKRGRKKKTVAKRSAVKESQEIDESVKFLLLKKTYASLNSAQLEKIRDMTGGLIDKAKESEKISLEKQIQRLQNKLEKI